MHPSAKMPKQRMRPRMGRWLIWAFVVALFCGVVDFGAPFEGALRTTRNKLIRHPVSGEVVVVGIDSASVHKYGDWPWRYGLHAEMVNKLHKMGAKQIGLDFYLTGAGTRSEERALAGALELARGKVYIGTQRHFDRHSDKTTIIEPRPAFAARANLASVDYSANAFGQVWRLPYAVEAEGVSRMSFASILGGRAGIAGESFPVDYSLDLKSIKTISAKDLLEGKVSPEAIRGRKVMVGVVWDALEDVHALPGFGSIPGVYFHVMGAETLLSGRPVEFGWFFVLLVTTAVGVFAKNAPSRFLGRAALAATFSALIGLPIFLEAHLIFVNVVPSLLLLAIVGIGRIRARLRNTDVSTDLVSGYDNFSALRQVSVEQGDIVVVAKIKRFPALAASMTPEYITELARLVRSRLSLGTGLQYLFHGENGTFGWVVPAEMAWALSDQLGALHALFNNGLPLNGHPIDLSVCFGVDSTAGRTISSRVDSALAAADQADESNMRWVGYDPVTPEDAEWQRSLLSQLNDGMTNGQVWIAYQPKLDLRTGKVTGAEALIRWTHPTKGEICPVEIIAACEQHDKISGLTHFVLKSAIRCASELQAKGIQFNIAVNLSPRMLDERDLVERLRELLLQHQLPAQRLTLEITETAELRNKTSAITMLKAIRLMGVSVSIDDYGTGLATLEYLQLLPVNEIKIDRKFINGMLEEQNCAVMVNSTIQLAHSLNCKVVAEGVESEATLDMLRSFKCDTVQGYLIGRPMTYSAIQSFIADQKSRAA